MKLFKTDQEIEKSIKSIETRGAKLRQDIHRTGCSIFRRWLETGDVRVAQKNFTALHNALGGAVRTNAFKDWVVAFGLMDWDKEEGFIKTKNKVTEEMVQSAIQNPFWEFSVEQEYKPLDWKQALNALVSRAAKDIEKMGDKSEVSKEQYQALLVMTSE